MSGRIDEFEARLRALRRVALLGFDERRRELEDAADRTERGEADGRELLRRLAHKLRGIAANLGHAGLGDEAMELERAIASGEADAQLAARGRSLARGVQAAMDGAAAEPPSELPPSPAPDGPSADPAEARAAAEPVALRVLALDDDAPTRRLLELTLCHAAQWNARITSDAEEALGLLREHAPQLVIVDAMMPGIDGFDFYRAVRRELGDEVPVVILSASDARELGWTIPADPRLRWMRKPMLPARLVRELRAFVGGPSLR